MEEIFAIFHLEQRTTEGVGLNIWFRARFGRVAVGDEVPDRGHIVGRIGDNLASSPAPDNFPAINKPVEGSWRCCRDGRERRYPTGDF